MCHIHSETDPELEGCGQPIAAEWGANNGFQDLCTHENGSRRGQKLTLTIFFVPTSLDSGTVREPQEAPYLGALPVPTAEQVGTAGLGLGVYFSGDGGWGWGEGVVNLRGS